MELCWFLPPGKLVNESCLVFLFVFCFFAGQPPCGAVDLYLVGGTWAKGAGCKRPSSAGADSWPRAGGAWGHWEWMASARLLWRDCCHKTPHLLLRWLKFINAKWNVLTLLCRAFHNALLVMWNRSEEIRGKSETVQQFASVSFSAFTQ